MENPRPIDEEEADLMDPASWEEDSAEVRKPVKKPRAVVSVAFQSADFEIVATKAREQGKTVSGFIREAALSQAENRVTSIHWSATSYVISMQGTMFPTTHIHAPAVNMESSPRDGSGLAVS